MMFVHIVDHECTAWGVGKFEDKKGGLATVTFFESPVKSLISIELPVAKLERIELPPETRVYWQDEKSGAWRVGRVLKDHCRWRPECPEVQVRFPNGDDRFLSPTEVYVRWDRLRSDPVDYLAGKVTETPAWRDGRIAFVKALTSQRAGCQGMQGLISSIIDLEPHQIEVIRRVLQDPIQRYLLADEVGLGKTIEAGVLIRQYVLDDPTGHSVVILVPLALKVQWEEELVCRFLLGQYLYDTVKVISTEEPISDLGQTIQKAGMLVIDEAHHLTRDKTIYDGLREAITRVPRLLLLSATPVLHNERDFLRMLHLLDPQIYLLDQEEAFRSRIECRQMLAETVAVLVPENLLELGRFLDRLNGKFKEDDLLHLYIRALRKIVDEFPDETNEQYRQALRQLRDHLSETYRLDRRILRNRRKNIKGLTPMRSGVNYIDYDSVLRQEVAMAVENWRDYIGAEMWGREDTHDWLGAACWFKELVAASLTDQKCKARMGELVQSRIILLEGERDNRDGFILSELPFLRKILIKVQDLENDTSRYDALTDYLRGQTEGKFVIFCTDYETAFLVTGYLRVHVDRRADRYDVNVEPGVKSVALSNFLNDPEHRFLVCDYQAEEGLNLQGGGKIIVHFDLPFSPNRVEQRIGRLDRYGSGDAIKSIVLRCTDDPIEVYWANYLEQGFGVFGQSIASLQYLIEEEMRGLSRELLNEGIESLATRTKSLSGLNGRVEEELRRIDEQDGLDALALPPKASLKELFTSDSDWRGFYKKVNSWLVHCLLMAKDSGPDVGPIPDEVFRLRLYLGRRRDGNTLLDLSKFATDFGNTLEINDLGRLSGDLLTYPYTCRRETALRRRSLDHSVRLLRLGDPFLEGLRLITVMDDRGCSTAIWRTVPGYNGSENVDIFVRFDFIVETDVEPAVGQYGHGGGKSTETARAALMRRGDMVFPPFFLGFWLDGGLRLVEDKERLSLLSQPYKQGRSGLERGYFDENLNYQRWQDVDAFDLPVMDSWSEWIAGARVAADSEIRDLADLGTRSNEALKRAKSTDSRHFSQLQSRINNSKGFEAKAQRQLLDLENSVAESFYAGILDPQITLDSIGAVFVSGESLRSS